MNKMADTNRFHCCATCQHFCVNKGDKGVKTKPPTPVADWGMRRNLPIVLIVGNRQSVFAN
ncbi:hypothetical protein [Brevibacillus laterosporus]|uniref:hypothetical protein n=1 Tax=Brevibacillus laterosporus TaxID=1465 RepID=UPI003D1D3EF4